LLDRTAAPLHRILDPLQGNEGVDATERAQGDCLALPLRRIALGEREARA